MNGKVGKILFLISILLAFAIIEVAFGTTVARAAGSSESGSQASTQGLEAGKAPAPASSCALPPLVEAPAPSEIPGYAQLDPSTGLHVTGTIQQINIESYRLGVTGKVGRPLTLAYDELRCMPRVTGRPVLVCPGFFTDTASWAGVSLKYVLELAGVEQGAEGVRLIGADNYTVSLPMDTATASGNFLAYEWEGKALPKLHGFPLRAVLPGMEGNQWVKWLVRIEVY